MNNLLCPHPETVMECFQERHNPISETTLLTYFCPKCGERKKIQIEYNSRTAFESVMTVTCDGTSPDMEIN